MRGAIFATILVVFLGACSLSDKDKDRADRVVEIVEPCVGLEGEELRDCLVERAIELEEMIVEKANN